MTCNNKPILIWPVLENWIATSANQVDVNHLILHCMEYDLYIISLSTVVLNSRDW